MFTRHSSRFLSVSYRFDYVDGLTRVKESQFHWKTKTSIKKWIWLRLHFYPLYCALPTRHCAPLEHLCALLKYCCQCALPRGHCVILKNQHFSEICQYALLKGQCTFLTNRWALLNQEISTHFLSIGGAHLKISTAHFFEDFWIKNDFFKNLVFTG